MEEGVQVSHGKLGIASLAWHSRLWPAPGKSAMEEGVQVPQPDTPGPAIERRLSFPSMAPQGLSGPAVASHGREWLSRACPALQGPVMEDGNAAFPAWLLSAWPALWRPAGEYREYNFPYLTPQCMASPGEVSRGREEHRFQVLASWGMARPGDISHGRGVPLSKPCPRGDQPLKKGHSFPGLTDP